MPWNLQNLQFIKRLKGKIIITKLLLNYNYNIFFFNKKLGKVNG
jgi:hypothetical protein